MDEIGRREGDAEVSDLIARIRREMEDAIGLIQKPYARPDRPQAGLALSAETSLRRLRASDPA